MPYFFGDAGGAIVTGPGSARPTPGAIDANDDAAPMVAGTSVTLNPITNDRAADGAALYLLSVEAPDLGTIDVEGDQITYFAPAGLTGVVIVPYTVASSTGAVAVGSISFTVTAPGTPTTPTTPVVEEPPPAPGSTVNALTFYKRGLPASGQASGHPWNIGTFSASNDPVARYLEFPVRVSGGLAFKIKQGISAHETTTWTEVAGGPFAGVVNPETKIADKSQGAIHLHGGTRAWVRREQGMGAGTWGWLAVTPMPMGGTWADVAAVIASTGPGRGRFDELSMLGARHRHIIDTYRGNSTDYLYCINRWAYEFNQDSGLQLSIPLVNGVRPGGKALNGFFMHPNATLSNFKQFLEASIKAYWHGYGYQMPMAISPAYESNSIPRTKNFMWNDETGSEGHPRYTDFLIPEMIICCGSYHPYPIRVQTAAAAKSTVYGGWTAEKKKFYTPRVIIDAARTTGRSAAFLEHSVPFDNPDFYFGDLTHSVTAYKWFGKICNDNKDIMSFTCLLGSGMCDESGGKLKSQMAIDFAAGRIPRGVPTQAELDDWRDLCRAYKNGPTAADNNAFNGSFNSRRTHGFGKVIPA